MKMVQAVPIPWFLMQASLYNDGLVRSRDGRHPPPGPRREVRFIAAQGWKC